MVYSGSKTLSPWCGENKAGAKLPPLGGTKIPRLFWVGEDVLAHSEHLRHPLTKSLTGGKATRLRGASRVTFLITMVRQLATFDFGYITGGYSHASISQARL